MRNHCFPAITTTFLLLLITVFLASITGCELNQEHERLVRLSEPFKAGGQFKVRTHNGSITSGGVDAETCNIKAIIIGKGTTIEEAKKVAESIEIHLDHSNGKLITRIDKPKLLEQKFYSINFDITLPLDTSLDLHTHNGSIIVYNINGTVRTVSHNGSIKTERITGSVNLTTHNGDIDCNDFKGNVHARTRNGSIRVDYDRNAFNVLNADIATHNGRIDIQTPDGLSAKLNAITHNGSIKTSLPVMVVGEIDKKNLQGTIGTVRGNLILKTHNGSISIE